MNNLKLETFAEQLYDYPLPPDTTVLTQSKQLQKVGNGNNCSYTAQQTLISALSVEEIEAFYTDVTLPRTSNGIWTNVYDPSAEIPIRVRIDASQADTKQVTFLLTLYDIGLDDTLDVRCH